MMDEQQNISGREAAGLIDDFIKLYDEFGVPTDEDVEQIEAQLGPLMGDDRPNKIAGNLAFFRLSRLLYPDKRLTMTELSEKLMIEKYGATRLVAWFVEKGLAERFGDPNDRRIVRVALTEKGQLFHETIESVAIRRCQNVMQRLTAEELTIFLRLFQKLAARIPSR